jgi:hypothetical protein
VQEPEEKNCEATQMLDQSVIVCAIAMGRAQQMMILSNGDYYWYHLVCCCHWRGVVALGMTLVVWCGQRTMDRCVAPNHTLGGLDYHKDHHNATSLSPLWATFQLKWTEWKHNQV